MLVSYAQQGSLAKAVAETFDGNHPCHLCKQIATVQHSQKKKDLPRLTVKPDLICATRPITLLPRSANISFLLLESGFSPRLDSPPTPPPRSARS
jgi:hypothetical protein